MMCMCGSETQRVLMPNFLSLLSCDSWQRFWLLATATMRGLRRPDTVISGHCSTLIVGRHGQLVRYGLAHSIEILERSPQLFIPGSISAERCPSH